MDNLLGRPRTPPRGGQLGPTAQTRFRQRLLGGFGEINGHWRVSPAFEDREDWTAEQIKAYVDGARTAFKAQGIGGRLFPRIPRHSQRFRDLYRGRAAIEREFGRLKHDYGLSPLRVRGLERVGLYADLTILVRLAQALTRARSVAVAA